MGGCVLAHEALSWASYMLGLNALPPDPRYRRRALARSYGWTRLAADRRCFLEAWLTHQLRDDYWRQGSICEDFAAAAAAAILLVGGWADGYTNARRSRARRAGRGRRARAAGWSARGATRWPEVVRSRTARSAFSRSACAGGTTGSTAPTTARWTSRCSARGSRSRSSAGVRPAACAQGAGCPKQQWPSPRIGGRQLFPSGDGGLERQPSLPDRRLCVGDSLAGSDAGAWCPYGRPTDFPPDQRAEDGRALAFTTPAADRAGGDSRGARW